MKLRLISFLAEIWHVGLYEVVNTLLRITGLNLKLAEVHTTSLAEQTLSHPKECVLQQTPRRLLSPPNLILAFGAVGGAGSHVRPGSGGVRQVCVLRR